MTQNALAGIAFMTVSGRRMRVVGQATYKVAKKNRETLKGQDGVHGFKEMPEAGRISATIRDDAGLKLTTVNSWSDETVVLELANGKTIVGRNMWTTDTQEVETEEASYSLVFESNDVSEA
jgi:hypothetical protein